jgi:protoheme IX farnesyltransferase
MISNTATSKLKEYYRLTKPGIIYGNAITLIAGFLFATHKHFHLVLFLSVLIGTSLVIACGCVINNYIDRSIDKKMTRTRNRALVNGRISGQAAIIYASALGILGFTLLATKVNAVVVSIGFVGLIDYILLYGYGKRTSVHGTLIGSIAGATPIIAGYCAVTGRIDFAAVLLFLIMAIWQMPHFYAIAIYRLNDYKAAGLPVWPAKKGIVSTKIQIIGYVLLFIASVSILTGRGYTGYVFFVITLLVGVWWLILAVKGLKATDNDTWGRKLFGSSLLVLLVFSIFLSLNGLLS